MPRIFPKGHKTHAEGMRVFEAHDKANIIFKGYMENHKQVFEQFKQWFNRFGNLQQKIVKRDKAQEKFKHYYEKLSTMRKERTQKINNVPGYNESPPAIKDAEVLARVIQF